MASCCLALFVFLPAASKAAPTESGGFRQHARAVYDNAHARWLQSPTNLAAVVDFGRTCFDLAEFATNATERAAIAEQGIAACQRTLETASNSAAAHYYLAMNVAQLARTKSLGALKLVGQMHREFEAARKLDETIDYAGPDRYLGMLYRDTPALLSLGDKAKALKHLEKALSLAPRYPDNHLALIEGQLGWGQAAAARKQLAAYAAIRPAARETLSGPDWAARWADWDADFARFQKQAVDARPELQPIKDRR